MKRAKILDIIKASLLGGTVRADSVLEYDQDRNIDDLPDRGLVTKDMLLTAVGAQPSKTSIYRTGADINTDGNVTVDDVPVDADLIAVYINGEPDFTQHFYSPSQQLVYGFDTSTDPGTEIILKFI